MCHSQALSNVMIIAGKAGQKCTCDPAQGVISAPQHRDSGGLWLLSAAVSPGLAWEQLC